MDTWLKPVANYFKNEFFELVSALNFMVLYLEGHVLMIAAIMAAIIAVAISAYDWRKRPSTVAAQYLLMIVLVAAIVANEVVGGSVLVKPVTIALSFLSSALAITLAARYSFGVVLPLGVTTLKEAGLVFGGLLTAIVSSPAISDVAVKVDETSSIFTISILIVSLVLAFRGSLMEHGLYGTIALIVGGMVIVENYNFYSPAVSSEIKVAGDIGFIMIAALPLFVTPSDETMAFGQAVVKSKEVVRKSATILRSKLRPLFWKAGKF